MKTFTSIYGYQNSPESYSHGHLTRPIQSCRADRAERSKGYVPFEKKDALLNEACGAWGRI